MRKSTQIDANNAYEVNIYDKRPDQSYRTGAIVEVAKPASVIRPETIKKNPRLQGVGIPNTGAQTRGTGLLVTNTLLFGGEGGANPVLRAWDKTTGAVVAEIQLPGPTTGFPVTYTKAGRQYVAGAARVGDAVEIVALARPAAATK